MVTSALLVNSDNDADLDNLVALMVFRYLFSGILSLPALLLALAIGCLVFGGLIGFGAGLLVHALGSSLPAFFGLPVLDDPSVIPDDATIFVLIGDPGRWDVNLALLIGTVVAFLATASAVGGLVGLYSALMMGNILVWLWRRCFCATDPAVGAGSRS